MVHFHPPDTSLLFNPHSPVDLLGVYREVFGESNERGSRFSNTGFHRFFFVLLFPFIELLLHHTKYNITW